MIKQKILLIRRWVLRHLVPEWYWPGQVNVDGVGIKIRNTPYTFGTRWLIHKGLYEKEERELLREVLRPGMKVIEMGGSIGVLSAVMAKAIGKNGQLVSVEASEKLTCYSKTWLEKLGNVKVVTGFAFPVGEAPCVQIKNFDEVAGSLGGTLSFDLNGSHERVKNSPNVYDIAKLCSRYDIIPDILVVDVEGSEIIMINQSINLPASIKCLLIELHDGMYHNGKEDEKLILEALNRDGFQLKKRLVNVCLFVRN